MGNWHSQFFLTLPLLNGGSCFLRQQQQPYRSQKEDVHYAKCKVSLWGKTHFRAVSTRHNKQTGEKIRCLVNGGFFHNKNTFLDYTLEE